MHIRAPDDSGDSWLAQFIRFAAIESDRHLPGGEAVLERLSEMMFVDLIRRHLDQLPADQNSWLAGLRDRFVGRALSLLHDQPATHWTIEQLADQVGLSRSALHERFVQFIGQPPMQYLTGWRMQLASELLIRTHASVSSVALDAGYQSEAAFARAFKRATGSPPARWRRERAQLGKEAVHSGLSRGGSPTS
jgi:transcriptional regulator GlxA family with amidase domain